MADRTQVEVDDFLELLSVTQELVKSLAPIVIRLESLPDAEPMDTIRPTILHMVDQLDSLFSTYLGTHEQTAIPDFTHPDYQDKEP